MALYVFSFDVIIVYLCGFWKAGVDIKESMHLRPVINSVMRRNNKVRIVA